MAEVSKPVFPPRKPEDVTGYSTYHPKSGGKPGQYFDGKSALKQTVKQKPPIKAKWQIVASTRRRDSARDRKRHSPPLVHDLLGVVEQSVKQEAALKKEIAELKKELDSHYSGKNLIFMSTNVVVFSFLSYAIWKTTGFKLIDPYFNLFVMVSALIFFIMGVLKKRNG